MVKGVSQYDNRGTVTSGAGARQYDNRGTVTSGAGASQYDNRGKGKSSAGVTAGVNKPIGKRPRLPSDDEGNDDDVNVSGYGGDAVDDSWDHGRPDLKSSNKKNVTSTKKVAGKSPIGGKSGSGIVVKSTAISGKLLVLLLVV